jgi:hypothetical protein
VIVSLQLLDRTKHTGSTNGDGLNVAVGGNADSTDKGGEEGLGGERRHLEGC